MKNIHKYASVFSGIVLILFGCASEPTIQTDNDIVAIGGEHETINRISLFRPVPKEGFHSCFDDPKVAESYTSLDFPSSHSSLILQSDADAADAARIVQCLQNTMESGQITLAADSVIVREITITSDNQPHSDGLIYEKIVIDSELNEESERCLAESDISEIRIDSDSPDSRVTLMLRDGIETVEATQVLACLTETINGAKINIFGSGNISNLPIGDYNFISTTN